GPTAPNAKGELPPSELRYLTSSTFPEGSKKGKGDYNPPQAHLMAASRMFRTFGTDAGIKRDGKSGGRFEQRQLCERPQRISPAPSGEYLLSLVRRNPGCSTRRASAQNFTGTPVSPPQMAPPPAETRPPQSRIPDAAAASDGK
ncbi:hypothetical protein PF001_g30859, partial [Phytophthora fragariae]